MGLAVWPCILHLSPALFLTYENGMTVLELALLTLTGVMMRTCVSSKRGRIKLDTRSLMYILILSSNMYWYVVYNAASVLQSCVIYLYFNLHAVTLVEFSVFFGMYDVVCLVVC